MHRSFSVIPCNHAHYTHTHTRIRPLVAARSHSRSRTRARHPRAAHAHCSHTSPMTSQAASSGSEVLTVHCSAVRGARPVCVLRLHESTFGHDFAAGLHRLHGFHCLLHGGHGCRG